MSEKNMQFIIYEKEFELHLYVILKSFNLELFKNKKILSILQRQYIKCI